MSQELFDGFNMVPPQVSCHTQEVVQGLQPGETAQGLHQLEQDGTAQGPSHDGRPSDYTTVKKSRWAPPLSLMKGSIVLSTTTMASNDLSTTNTALDVSSVTAVSSEPVLAGTNLAGTDLAGSGADSYIFKFLTEDPRSKEYQVQVTTLIDIKVPPPSPDIITLWQRLIPKMIEAAGDDEVPTRQLRLELEDRMGYDRKALRPYKVLIDKLIFEAIDAFNSAIDAEADAKRARECTASISAVI